MVLSTQAISAVTFVALITIHLPVSETATASDDRFTLLKGEEIAVCNAYLKRLNTTKYHEPPYCGRPEVNNAPGFTELKRTPISIETTHVLYPRLSRFMSIGEQGNKELDLRQSKGWGPDGKMHKEIGRYIENGETKVWRYLPPVDIDNDGKQDNIIVWQGMGAGRSTGKCGVAGPPSFSAPKRSVQVAFFADLKNERIDTTKTKLVFKHPSGGYKLPNGKMSRRFRPIGKSIGIFKYQNRYYFDTFFDGWGDLDNRRASQSDISNILAVLLHRDGKTQQICEFRMTDLEESEKNK